MFDSQISLKVLILEKMSKNCFVVKKKKIHAEARKLNFVLKMLKLLKNYVKIKI